MLINVLLAVPLTLFISNRLSQILYIELEQTVIHQIRTQLALGRLITVILDGLLLFIVIRNQCWQPRVIYEALIPLTFAVDALQERITKQIDRERLRSPAEVPHLLETRKLLLHV